VGSGDPETLQETPVSTEPQHSLLSPQEYLEMERQAESKSEYYEGEIVAMTGASWEHNLIVADVLASLHQQLGSRSCGAAHSDLRVRISPAGVYVNPDLVVVCGKPEIEDDHVDTFIDPTVVIEVSSPSTEANDHGRKWEPYRRLRSLQEYLLIAQDRPHLERYRPHGDGVWLFDETDGIEATLALDAIECTLTSREVYEGVL
jgi:Uma2 family endonuclease